MGFGCLHIYTGTGKGKTTAAIGLAIRSAGAGKKVAFVQFDKGYDGEKEFYSERNLIRKIENIDLFCYGCGRINPDGTFRTTITDEDRAEAQKALRCSEQLLQVQTYFLIVLDEIITSAHIGLISQKELFKLVEMFKRNRFSELVMTGIKAPEELMQISDLVTEMKNIKHYYTTGRKVIKGIEF